MSDIPATDPQRGGTPVIDIHCHVGAPECEPLVRDLYRSELEPFDHFGGVSSVYNREHFAAIAPKLTNPDERLADMDRMGVDLQAISIAPPQYYYWTEPISARGCPVWRTSGWPSCAASTRTGSSVWAPCRSRTPRPR